MIYIVCINDKEYEVEVERGKANIINVSTAQAAQLVTAAAPVIQQPDPVQQPVGNGEPFTAPMSGAITDIKVKAGDNFKKGDILLILEAMKMENEIVAPRDGSVEQVLTSKGANVSIGDMLLMLK